MKHFFLVFVLSLSILPSFCQEIEWVVELRENIGLYYKGVAPYYKDGKSGLVNLKGKFILEPVFKDVLPIQYDYVIVSDSSGKFGLYNLKGEKLVSHIYDWISEYNDTIVKVKKGDKWGFADIYGKELSLIEYGSTINYFNGVINGYREERNANFIKHIPCLENNKGENLSSLKFDYTGSWGDGLLFVKVDEKYGFLNTRGNLVIPLEYDEAKDFSEGLAAVRKGGRWGFINTQGEIVIPFKFKYAHKFNNGYCSAILKDKYGLIDKNGEPVSLFEYSFIEKVYDNVMVVMQGAKFGLVDFSGKIIIPFEHNFFDGQISEGLVAFQKGYYYGFYNLRGKLVIPFEYDLVTPFVKGEASVKKDTKSGVIRLK